jgi:hypothetical protein
LCRWFIKLAAEHRGWERVVSEMIALRLLRCTKGLLLLLERLSKGRLLEGATSESLICTTVLGLLLLLGHP